MAVQNRIRKVQKRDRSLVPFDQGRIVHAILRAARSVGGFALDLLPGVNDRLFAYGDDEHIAEFLSDVVITVLNRDPRHWVANFPPTIEEIQDTVLHVLRSFGFVTVADAYECWRWGKYWVRVGAITLDQFVGNGYPSPFHDEILAWNRDHGCDTVDGLNAIVRSGRLPDLVAAATERYERSVDEAAEEILRRIERGDDLRMIWISGPSSSGKTTTTVKLTARLGKEGLQFLMLNLDDYFWPLVEHPTDWLNDRNFETPEALDIQAINRHLRALLEGETVEKPIYSFKEGRHVGTKPVRLKKGHILLLDCLHGLYPPLTAGIERECMFRLYIEAANMLYEGDGASERLTQFTDVRLLRRMLRDVQHRNHPPLQTLLHWHYVRSGELFSIIPLMGLADHVVNGGMPFDLPVLKPFFVPDGIWPRPEEVAPYDSFLDARIRYRRITNLLSQVAGLTLWEAEDHGLIPGDHLVREFIGGSTLRIPHNE
ncbi:response regulator SirA [Candidatus Bipolaricaulota bacterium]|nr:response regulator SirA [Candidatus Bipolaricaulota bacterium]